MTDLNHIDDNLRHLLISCLEGSASAEEYRRLQEWLEADGENFRLFDGMRRTWLKSGQFAYDSEKGWRRIEERLASGRHRRRIRRLTGIFRYAAVIAILFSAGHFGYRHFFHRTDVSVPAGEILPGGNRAVLVLAGNRQVCLGDFTSDTVFQGNAVVEQGSGTLKYRGTSQDRDEGTNTLITPRGGEYSVILSDGTKVWLNAESRLTYPVRFHGGERKVRLEGEAYFDVERQDGVPFVVSSGEISITVLGTEFNVRNYGARRIETTLVEGTVRVYSRSGDECSLRPGQQAVLENDRLSVRKVEVTRYMAWKDGYFVYNEQRLEEIMDELSRWYDFDCFYQNASLKDMRIIARIRKFDHVEDIFRILSATGHLDFETNGRTVTVRGR